VMNNFKSSDTNFNDRILLIGGTDEVFAGRVAPEIPNIFHCADVQAGIEAARGGKFSTIAVAISLAGQKLNTILKYFRNTNPNSKIILLSQMSEELAALELVKAGDNGSRLADDYLICPVEPEDFCRLVIFAGTGEKEQSQNGTLVDIESRRRIRELERLATTDDLTGLKNRRYVWEFCTQIIEYTRTRGGKVTLLMFDIDYFKHYNDTYSHGAGDEILRQVAVLMRRCCRPQDVVGRIGGDEFVVIFWDVPEGRSAQKEAERRSLQSDHPKEVIIIAKRFRAELKKTQLSLLGSNCQGVLTISGGLASFPRDGSNAEELFAQADRALLDAKRSGKNRIYLVGSSQDDIGNIE
jgi:diguanylate cyclase (GGDEF)-like protein